VKSFFIGLIIGLIAAAAAYFAGQNKANTQVRALQSQLTEAQSRLAPLEATNTILRARGLVQSAVAALEQRNFGSADTDIKTASGLLESVPPGGGADADRLAALGKQLEDVKVRVSDDVGAQRSRLTDLAAQMDSLLPAPDAAPAPQPPTAPTDSTTP
jgi:hypothetical protein